MPNIENTQDLKAILASVYYLKSEAQKAGFDTISRLFIKLIADIESHLNKTGIGSALLVEDIVESDLYKVLCLLDRFSSLSRIDINVVVSQIERSAELSETSH